MNIKKIQKNGQMIAIVQSNELIITDAQSALDLMSTIRYEEDCDRIVINKEAIIEDFFKLSTRIAGDIMQKFINYKMKVAVVGDYSYYTSKPLKDFIYESNNGNNVFFTAREDEAIEKLSNAK